MLRVAEVNHIDELADHRLAWQSLWLQTRNASFFQSLDWLQLYWRHYGEQQRLRVVMVYDDRECVGILPLTVRKESTRMGTLRTLTYPLDDWGTFYGPIGVSPALTLLVGLQHLRGTQRDWDLLDLRWVDRDGCDHGRTGNAMLQAGLTCHQQAWAETATVDLSGTWEQYWAARTSKWRQNVARLERRLHHAGRVEYVRYRPQGMARGDGDPRLDLFDACCQVARRSWQGDSTTGTTLTHARVHAFLREAHVAAAHAGALDVNLLLLDRRPVAFAYNYYGRGRVLGLRMGYEPEFKSCGPGSVLHRLMLEDSFRRGDVQHDMGICYLDAKRGWLTSIGRSYRYTYFPSCLWRVQMLRLKRWLWDRVFGTRHVVCARIG